MPGVFISYRREDSAGHAGRLFDRLQTTLGDHRVFMDITGIEAGVDFVDTIERAVASCDVLLTVIGSEWLTCIGSTGRRRLDDPGDFTRIEVAAALKRKVRVIPVLIGGTSMPPARALPDEIKPLARRQAVELRDTRWDADADHLISVLERVLGSAASGQKPERSVAQVRKTEDYTLRLSTLDPPVDRPSQNQSVHPALPSRQLWAIAAMAGSVVAVMFVLFWMIPLLSRERVKPPSTTNPTAGLTQVPKVKDSTKPLENVVPPARGDQTSLDKRAAEPPSEKTANRLGDPSHAAAVKVPHVEGLPLTTAAQVMRRAGLIVESKSAPAHGVKAFVVTSQKPAPGALVPPRSRVALVYTVPGRTVPDLTGLPLKQALSELAALRFLLGELTAEPTNNVRANRVVLRQSPPPGTELEPGARVDLVYATTPALKVPNVTSQSVKDATAMLRRLGFTVQVTYEDSELVPAGNVLRQSPSAGEESTDDKPTVVLIVARPPASSTFHP